jgi:dTDP-4-dehydrorhamnose 3,5-epimerase
MEPDQSPVPLPPAAADPAVAGLEATAQKLSDVGPRGELRGQPIAGLRVRLTRPVAHEDGHLIEIARIGWDVLGGPIVQVHMTTTFPGRVRAWGLHRRTTDRLFVASGLVRVVCYDGRRDSPTYGRVSEMTLGDRNPGLVVVPPDVFHGWKNIGVTESIVINMPTAVYDYDRPDSLDLPWDTPAARDIIPYTW